MVHERNNFELLTILELMSQFTLNATFDSNLLQNCMLIGNFCL